MRLLTRMARFLGRVRETTDHAFMASMLAQAGEPEYARELMQAHMPASNGTELARERRAA